ncbi:GH36 C-terminal domain-containing protein [Agromyces sp. Soil535]|uniref:GH36 C-terminal domain-containing protein n=1 Tax=Agromyces sp. Soil535 TaxID=1736390 RepID=UPI0006F1F4BE|nr:GH36 C-terminal domain-containing protein [Agromyces sp. Soil535]KRE22494.1 hypothetical protein ASG80_11385 [Agromyces sp. Soil535]
MIHHLRAAGVSLLLDARGAGVPAILHWGRDLGDLDASGLASMADALVPGIPPGIEWNLAEATPRELDDIANWTEVFRRERALMHSGTVVRGDGADESRLVHGVVATDARRALFAVVALDSAEAALPPLARLPGLDPDARHRVRPLAPGDRPRTIVDAPPAWWDRGSAVLTGRTLAEVGLPVPLLAPEEALLLEVVAE